MNVFEKITTCLGKTGPQKQSTISSLIGVPANETQFALVKMAIMGFVEMRDLDKKDPLWALTHSTKKGFGKPTFDMPMEVKLSPAELTIAAAEVDDEMVSQPDRHPGAIKTQNDFVELLEARKLAKAAFMMKAKIHAKSVKIKPKGM